MLIPNCFVSRNEKKAERVSQTTGHKGEEDDNAPRRDESDLLIYEVSDEVLETAGSNETAAAFTLGSCTGLSECPG